MSFLLFGSDVFTHVSMFLTFLIIFPYLIQVLDLNLEARFPLDCHSALAVLIGATRLKMHHSAEEGIFGSHENIFSMDV